MVQELTDPVTEMSIRDISWRGKGSWYVELTTLPPANYLEGLGTKTYWNPRPSAVCRGIRLLQTNTSYSIVYFTTTRKLPSQKWDFIAQPFTAAHTQIIFSHTR